MSAPQNTLDQLASSVPSLPSIVQELQKELDNINSTPQSIEAIVEKDTSLSVRLLKLANSVFYGFSFKVNTVSQALMMIGLSELRSLVLATSMTRVFAGMSSSLVTMESFWRHSVACGICARQLAIRRREVNAEQFFTAGIIHDFGRLVLFKNLPDKSDEAIKLAIKDNIPITVAETKIFSFNHADLAARILKNWKFPESLCEIITMHHSPSPSSRYYKQGMIVHVADVIVDCMEIGSTAEGNISPAEVMPTDFFQNDFSLIGALMDEVESMTDEVVSIFTPNDSKT